MKFETRFNCGDKAWVFGERRPEQLTVGQIRIEYTKSAGLNGGVVEPGCGIAFDNYKPKEETYEEVYMCVETGIGSGTLWRLGQTIFATEAECLTANEERLAEIEREKQVRLQWEAEQIEAEERDLERRRAALDRKRAAISKATASAA